MWMLHSSRKLSGVLTIAEEEVLQWSSGTAAMLARNSNKCFGNDAKKGPVQQSAAVVHMGQEGTEA